MAAPYSIEIFVPEGDPEGLKILSPKIELVSVWYSAEAPG